MRPAPSESVLTWLSGQPVAALYVTSISQAEILYGLALMPESRRWRALEEQIQAMFAEEFAGRILSFDPPAAPSYAEIAGRHQSGKRLQAMDGLILAIAHVHGAAVATRDRDLANCGVPIIDPWKHDG